MVETVLVAWHYLLYGSYIINARLPGPPAHMTLFAVRRDAVILQHQYEMPGGSVHHSVFDNLLLLHLGHSGRAQIIDVAGSGSVAVSAAQPFAMAQLGVGRHMSSSLCSSFCCGCPPVE